MPESSSIDINEVTSLGALLRDAGVPEGVPLDAIEIEYGGCGSHGVVLRWNAARIDHPGPCSFDPDAHQCSGCGRIDVGLEPAAPVATENGTLAFPAGTRLGSIIEELVAQLAADGSLRHACTPPVTDAEVSALAAWLYPGDPAFSDDPWDVWPPVRSCLVSIVKAGWRVQWPDGEYRVLTADPRRHQDGAVILTSGDATIALDSLHGITSIPAGPPPPAPNPKDD